MSTTARPAHLDIGWYGIHCSASIDAGQVGVQPGDTDIALLRGPGVPNEQTQSPDPDRLPVSSVSQTVVNTEIRALGQASGVAFAVTSIDQPMFHASTVGPP